MNKLHELIKFYREKAKLSPKQTAQRLGISYAYYTRLEHPYHEGRAIPSEDLLRKFVEVVVDDAAEKEKALVALLKERTKLFIPPEVIENLSGEITKSDLNSGEKEAFVNSMPKDFLNRLAKDIEYVGMAKVVRALGCSQVFIDNVLQGKVHLSKPAVVRLATILEQPVEEYLVLAGYMPDNLMNLLGNPKEAQVLFRLVQKIPQSKLAMFLSKVEELLDLQKIQSKQDK